MCCPAADAFGWLLAAGADHTTIGIEAFAAGLHVLTEKPISVHKADCEKLIAAYDARPNKEQKFGAMFNNRARAALTTGCVCVRVCLSLGRGGGREGEGAAGAYAAPSVVASPAARARVPE